MDVYLAGPEKNRERVSDMTDKVEIANLKSALKRAHHVMSGYREDMEDLKAENAVLVEALRKITGEGSIIARSAAHSYRYARECAIEALKKTGNQ